MQERKGKQRVENAPDGERTSQKRKENPLWLLEARPQT